MKYANDTRRATAPFLGLLALLMLPGSIWAQFTTGTILGTVTDPSGAAVPEAVVTATNLETGFARNAKTDQAGDFTLVNVPLGNYQVRAEAPGFKAAVSGPFTLVVDQKLRSDFKLDLGAITQVVEVAGVGATLLQTDAPDMNQIVQDKEIRGLPLNGRDFLSLLLLSNGLQDTSNDQGGATTNVTFAVNGMRPEANSVTLDGIEMSTIRESDVDMRPNIDAISEFKVLTFELFSGVRSHGRRRHLHPIESWHEYVSRQRVRVLPQRRLERYELLHGTRPAEPWRRQFQSASEVEHVRRDLRRADQDEQNVFLRRLSRLSNPQGQHRLCARAAGGLPRGGLLFAAS